MWDSTSGHNDDVRALCKYVPLFRPGVESKLDAARVAYADDGSFPTNRDKSVIMYVVLTLLVFLPAAHSMHFFSHRILEL